MPAGVRHLAAQASRANPVEVARDGLGRSLTLVGRASCEGRPVTAGGLLERWPDPGVALAPAGLDGPFVAALHDPALSALTLLRGPLGRLPLYYHRGSVGELSWSTRLGPLLEAVETPRVAREALCEVLDTRWTVGDRALVEGVEQVLAGSAVRFAWTGGGWEREDAVVADVRFAPPDPGRLAPVADGEVAALTGRVGEALSAAVAKALVDAERPAVLLSGGVDSSLLAALALAVRPDIVALTPTWTDHPDREIDRALRYAGHLGVAHEVIPLADDEIARAAPAFVRHLERPPRDYWAVALYAALAKVEGRFDVILHGEGADTLFGNGRIARIRNVLRKWRLLRYVPARNALARPLRRRNGWARRLGEMLVTDPDRAVLRVFALPAPDRLRERAPELFTDRMPEAVLARAWDAAEEPYARSQRFALHTSGQAHLRELTAMEDALGFRFECPFLASGVLAVAATLPNGVKLRGEETKPLLRLLSARYFPDSWGREPKLGFPTPRSGWLTGSLADWVARGLGPESVGRALLGSEIERLDPVADHELVWTLVTLDETARALGLAVPRWER